jgi:hypothetical protein
VSEIPLPMEFAGKSIRNQTRKDFSGIKQSANIGKLTLLARKPYYWLDLTYSRNKDWQNENSAYGICSRLENLDLPLTKTKLSKILTQLMLFKEFLPARILAEIKYFESYLNHNTWWVEVKEIKRNLGLEQTYDFSLPKTHRFVANGMINHNSGKSSSGTLVSKISKAGGDDPCYAEEYRVDWHFCLAYLCKGIQPFVDSFCQHYQ